MERGLPAVACGTSATPTPQAHSRDLAALKKADYSILPSLRGFMTTLRAVVALRKEVQDCFTDIAAGILHINVSTAVACRMPAGCHYPGPNTGSHPTDLRQVPVAAGHGSLASAAAAAAADSQRLSSGHCWAARGGALDDKEPAGPLPRRPGPCHQCRGRGGRGCGRCH